MSLCYFKLSLWQSAMQQQKTDATTSDGICEMVRKTSLGDLPSLKAGRCTFRNMKMLTA